MIRVAVEADVGEILEIYAPYILSTTITFEYDVPCLNSFYQRFYSVTEQFPWLVWEEDGQILGYAYATRPFERAAYSWCAEPAIYLRPEARGRGIGAKLYNALEALLKMQGYQVLYALITEENRDSLRFHEKQGYHLAGTFSNCGYKFSRWLGVFWMEKRMISVENPSSFPTPWKQIGQNSQLISDILYNLSLS